MNNCNGFALRDAARKQQTPPRGATKHLARVRNRQWPHSNENCSLPTREALLNTSAAKSPNARAIAYPSTGCQIQLERRLLRQRGELCYTQARPNGRMSAPAATPARVAKSKGNMHCKNVRIFCSAQSQPNTRITAPAGTPTQWPQFGRQQIIAFLACADRNPKCAHGTETPSGQAFIWQVVIRSWQKPPRITTNHLARVRNTRRLMQTFAGRKRAEALLHAIAAKRPNCRASGYSSRLRRLYIACTSLHRLQRRNAPAGESKRRRNPKP